MKTLILLLILTGSSYAKTEARIIGTYQMHTCENEKLTALFCSNKEYEAIYDGCHWHCVPNSTQKEIKELQGHVDKLAQEVIKLKEEDEYITNVIQEMK